MPGHSPFHNDPNPFASFLFGFPVIDEHSGPSEPGDVSDATSLNDKLDLILMRLDMLESRQSPQPEFASILSNLA